MKRILLDGFFHMPPGHRLSRNIATAGYRTNYGRYFPLDTYHPNGSSMLFSDLLANFDLKVLNQPFCEATLAEADILMVPNPDYPLYEGVSPYRLDAYDLEALMRFLNRGGSVVLLINSFLPRGCYWEENFDLERVAPLLERLGVSWDPNFMSDEKSILPAKTADFTVGYGQGGRVFQARLPQSAEPLLTCDGDVFGFLIGVGRGRMAVIGDAGLVSNGLYHFPGFENARFLRGLFEALVPAWEGRGSFECLEFGHLSCATSESGITDRIFKALRPNAEYQVDHHYRHLTYETAPATLSRADALARLPIAPDRLAGTKAVSACIPYVNLCEGHPTASFDITLTVSESNSEIGGDFIICGTTVKEQPAWADIGADPAVFEGIGELVRVSVVLQIQAGTYPDGSLRYFSMRQGQISYDRNARNAQYGFDLMLCSRNLVLSRTVAAGSASA